MAVLVLLGIFTHLIISEVNLNRQLVKRNYNDWAGGAPFHST